MRKPWWERALALLLGIWFAINMAVPTALHSCPMHDGTAAGHAASHAAGHAAPSAAHHVAHGHASAPAPAHRAAGHQCTCLGDCGVGAAAVLPAMHPALWVPVAVAQEVPCPRALAVAPPAADFVLPFANGPPHRA